MEERFIKNNSFSEKKQPVAAVLAGLVAMGVVYNQFIDALEEHGRDGITSLLVAVGVLYTVLLAGPVIGWRAVRFVLVAFAASGSPMILGNWRRWWRREARSR